MFAKRGNSVLSFEFRLGVDRRKGFSVLAVLLTLRNAGSNTALLLLVTDP